MAVSFFLTSFILSIMALSVSLNFRVAKFLNLSLAGIFASGAYMAYFSGNPAIPVFSGFLLGYLLAFYILRICRSVIEATIASLGLGLLIERVLEIVHRSSYYYIVNSDLSTMIIPLGLAMFLGLLSIYISPLGLRLKYVESDVELAEMYGVDTERYITLTVAATSSVVMLSGYFYAGALAIGPAIGFGYLISGIIVSAIAAQLSFRGVWHYSAVFVLSMLMTRVLEVLV
ncbi:Branched-chain amino acid ABC-type transport system, permease component [Geoglobus ahangari]|uniref:Branched-chain amino acid ABC-type transport system, permease component n=2 Tax=Geoglobus ahangari TaxID=113653 RepID=A0A0F7IDZ2_9EURY|nr:Branched-chain amino acid ABC-type transport system, permease component [Geoglobus ahangari]